MRLDQSYNVDPHDLVMEFHTTYGMPVGSNEGPKLLTEERTQLRWDLIDEEINDELLKAIKDGDIVEIADALGDAVYVIYGMAIEMGINLALVLESIHASNMSKLDDDGLPIYRADGKVLKGPSFFPPDIEGVLNGDYDG